MAAVDHGDDDDDDDDDDHTVYVWSMSITVIVSYPAHRQNDRQTE